MFGLGLGKKKWYKKLKLRELFWIIGIIVLVIALHFLNFGVDGFKRDVVLDINVHDTYFVVENSHILLLSSVFVLFFVYLIRMLSTSFKNLTVNIIWIIVSLSFLWILFGIISMVNSYIEISETTEYNLPISRNDFKTVVFGLYVIQILIGSLIVFTGFKSRGLIK